MKSHHTLASLKKIFKRASADRPNKLVEYETTLVNNHLYSCDAVSQYVEREPRYSEKRETKRFSAVGKMADNSCK